MAGRYGGAVARRFASSAQAADEATRPTDTNAEIKALRERLEALEAKQKSDEAAVRIDKALTDVTRDAGTRGQLVSPILAEYNLEKGVQIRSQDGSFTFHPNLQFMFRNVTNSREDIKGGGTEDDVQNGFEVRRMKFGFDGTAGADLKYYFLWATNRKTGGPVLEEAFVIYKLGNFGLPNPISIQAGEIKNYFATSPWAAQSASSRPNERCSTMSSPAATTSSKGPRSFTTKAAKADRCGPPSSSTTAPTTPTPTSRTSHQQVGLGRSGPRRFQALRQLGRLRRLHRPRHQGGPAGVRRRLDYSEAGDFAQFMQTVDVQYKAGPFAAYAAFLGRSLRHAGIGGAGTGTANPATAGTDNFYDYGVLAKVGWMLDPKFELFGQGSYIRFDSGEFADGVETTCTRSLSARTTTSADTVPSSPPTSPGCQRLAGGKRRRRHPGLAEW
jgi:hypothetical protein